MTVVHEEENKSAVQPLFILVGGEFSMWIRATASLAKRSTNQTDCKSVTSSRSLSNAFLDKVF
jgi:hypothetical protein